MIIFAGNRGKLDQFSTSVLYWYEGEKPYSLPLLLNFCNHSSTFEWGYGGSGPAQLAWVMIYLTLISMTDVWEDEAKASADLYHQGYKWAVIAGLPYDGWQICGKSVLDWLAKQGYNPSTSLD